MSLRSGSNALNKPLFVHDQHGVGKAVVPSDVVAAHNAQTLDPLDKLYTAREWLALSAGCFVPLFPEKWAEFLNRREREVADA